MIPPVSDSSKYHENRENVSGHKVQQNPAHLVGQNRFQKNAHSVTGTFKKRIFSKASESGSHKKTDAVSSSRVFKKINRKVQNTRVILNYMKRTVEDIGNKFAQTKVGKEAKTKARYTQVALRKLTKSTKAAKKSVENKVVKGMEHVLPSKERISKVVNPLIARGMEARHHIPRPGKNT